MDQSYLSIDMTADRLGVHPKTIRRYIGNGKLSAQKIGGTWRVHENSIEQYINNCEKNEVSHNHVSKDDFCIFMDSEYFNSKDTLQVCTIVDYYVKKEEFKSLLKDVIEVVTDYTIESRSSRFNYVYDDSENKMRLVFWGAPSYMGKVMEAMKNYEN